MEKIDILKATEFTSPNPLTLICTQKPDGSTNLAPVSFVSYLSFNPPMIGFGMGKGAYTGESVRETGKAVITVPADGLQEQIIACGTSSGSNTNKADKFNVALTKIEGSEIKIPANTKLAFVATLNQTIETGDHFFYICDVEQIYGDTAKEALFAWNGYSQLAPAQQK